MPVLCLLSLISRNSPKQLGMVSPELGETVIPVMQTIVIRASMRVYSTIEAPLWSRPNSLAALMIQLNGVSRNAEGRQGY